MLSRSGEYLTYADDWGAPQLCVKGTAIASIRNTDSVYVQGPLVGASDGYTIDEFPGAFAPGLTREATGKSEIELDFNPSGSVEPVVHVRGTEQADHHIIVAGKGQVERSTPHRLSTARAASSSTGARATTTSTAAASASSGPPWSRRACAAATATTS